MSDRFGAFDEDAYMAGEYAAWTRSESRHGRRHHDHDNRWTRYEPRQDAD